jgi:DNA-binding MarR family transcriptional regulator
MKSSEKQHTGVAFLLAQIGAHAADRFGERVKVLGMSRPHAGILRLIAATPSCNQQELAKRLGVLPSRMVILIDELTERKWIERRRSQKDRRHSELVLTKTGGQMLEKVSQLAEKHEADLCAALSPEERHVLATLCRKIADQQGLAPGVHPGFRRL